MDCFDQKIKAQYISLYFFLALCIPQGALAKNQSTSSHSSVSLRAGSAGWGVEYKARIQPHLDLRFVWQTLSPGRFEVNTDSLDTNSIKTNSIKTTSYQAQGSFSSSGVISDWYPWTTPIRFSFGIVQNTSQFRLNEKTSTLHPKNQYDANFGQLGYFFGTGWAPRKSNQRLTLTLDVGLLAQQPPRITWQADAVTRTTEQTAQIWSEKRLLKQELEEYKILPFFMIGLNYKIY